MPGRSDRVSGPSDGVSGPSGRVRLFVALELPDPIRAELWRWGRGALTGLADVRLLDPESMHVTLCFLGSLPSAEVAGIAGACRGAAGMPAPHGALESPVWLPVQRPRVLAVGIDDEHGEFAALQSALATALAGGGWFEPECRRFFPHVTVARVSGRKAAQARLPQPSSPARQLPLVGEAVVLHQSHLGPGGARYEALERVPLTPVEPAP